MQHFSSQTIVFSKGRTEEDSGTQPVTSKDSMETFASLATRGSHEDIDGSAVHEDFRLFVSTQAGAKQLIPGKMRGFSFHSIAEIDLLFSNF